VLGDAGLVAFVASRDLEVAGRFYGEVLGFRLLETSTFSDAYDANGTQLRVTVVDRVVQAPYTVLGWRVLDIVATIGRFVRRGWRSSATRVWSRTRTASGSRQEVRASRGSPIQTAMSCHFSSRPRPERPTAAAVLAQMRSSWVT
jgi:hypothetical protein